jgi:hypothetical protein
MPTSGRIGLDKEPIHQIRTLDYVIAAQATLMSKWLGLSDG